MDNILLKTLLSRLTCHSFARFVFTLLNADGKTSPLSECGEQVFVQPLLDSYGSSLHSVFILHYSPLDLIRGDKALLLSDPVLAAKVKAVHQQYKGQYGQWGMVAPFLKSARKLQSLAFITNLVGISRDDYETNVIPQYSQLVHKMRLAKDHLYIGSYDSFVALRPEATQSAFAKFITQNTDALRIALDPDDIRVERVSSECHLSAGVLSHSRVPSEPVYQARLRKDEGTLQELELLLRQNVSEARLEAFLAEHYRLIFGPQYDRIETQLWLRFPELDLVEKSRRLDIFLRNAISGDWELTELKRSNIRLTGTDRDVPVLTHAVTNALYQTRNYAKLLSQDSVRRKLADDGIEYYEPSLSLVIGRRPDISHEHWRWLLKSGGDVRIATYDDILDEMKIRVSERASLL